LKAIGESLEKQFSFLFDQLNIKGTREVIDRLVKAPEIHRPEPPAIKSGQKESIEGLSD